MHKIQQANAHFSWLLLERLAGAGFRVCGHATLEKDKALLSLMG